ncbi:hypothetical protein [Pajaroellobacter abortibovis]|nr:hypothetical protein [Pajaroellobacter abortibovis]
MRQRKAQAKKKRRILKTKEEKKMIKAPAKRMSRKSAAASKGTEVVE